MRKEMRIPDREERAKQFMPFAALKGHMEALRRMEKTVVAKAELSEEYREELDRKFQQIKKKDVVTVIYFYKNEYLKKTGMVARLDTSARILQVVQTKIPFDDIYDIEREEPAVRPEGCRRNKK